MTHEAEDSALIRRVVQFDDRRAFDALVRRHQSSLRQSLRRLLGGDPALADELAQETFLRAYRALASFRGESRFQTWLYRIAWRLRASQLRVRSVATEPMTDDNKASAAASPEGERDSERFRNDYDRALLSLTHDQRMAVHLALELGFTHTEIAEVMALPLGTVKSHVQRARQHLADLLAKWKGVSFDDL